MSSFVCHCAWLPVQFSSPSSFNDAVAADQFALIAAASRATRYVLFLSVEYVDGQSPNWHELMFVTSSVLNVAAKEALLHGNPLLDVRILFPKMYPSSFSPTSYPDLHVVFSPSSLAAERLQVQFDINPKRQLANLSSIKFQVLTPIPVHFPPYKGSSDVSSFPRYRHAVAGGTFDHLHAGHKVMLVACALCCSQRLLIGLTSEALLVKKQFAEFLQTFEQREKILREFLNTVRSDIEYDIQVLTDPVGPAGPDPLLEVIVLTVETAAGGEMVNKSRTERRLNQLDVLVIDLVALEGDHFESVAIAQKFSSTDVRKYLATKTGHDIKPLHEKWDRLCQSLAIPTHIAANWWSTLRDLYLESWRYYHSIHHIESLLNQVDEFRPLIQRPELLELAVWFHDAIYIPESKTNEKDSAKLFEEFLQQVDSTIDGSAVTRFILSTETHKPLMDGDNDLLLFLDMDLSVLGWPSDQYQLYSEQIRKEYICYSDSVFREGRIKVLNRLLNKGDLFYTDLFKQRYQNQAVDNMNRELQMLTDMKSTSNL